MSRSSHPGYGNYYSHSHLHPDAGPPARRIAPGAYTFGHRGRQIRFGPIAFWSVVGGLGIMAGAAPPPPAPLALREGGLARLTAPQAHPHDPPERRATAVRDPAALRARSR